MMPKPNQANVAYEYQSKLTFSGIVEADGTGLRAFHKKDKMVHIGCWGLVERPQAHLSSYFRMALWVTDGTETSKRSAPPVESIRQVKGTGGLGQLKKNTLLVTDGASLYPGLARQHQLRHKQVTHSKGQFVTYSRTRKVSTKGLGPKRERLAIHTGLIDRVWGMLKDYIPKQISGRNIPELKVYVGSFMFRQRWTSMQRGQQLAKYLFKVQTQNEKGIADNI